MEIEKNASFPPKRRTAKMGQSKYNFKEMQMNDSFIVEDERKRFSVSILARKFGNNCDPVRKFSVKRDVEGILRCIRIL